jgi:hypothetical protein
MRCGDRSPPAFWVALRCVAFVGFRMRDRVYGLSADQAQFLAGTLRRRLTVPEPVEQLADGELAAALARELADS